MGTLYPLNIPLTLFSMFHCPTVAPQHDKSNLYSLSTSEIRAQERREEFYKAGQGYFHIQRTKVRLEYLTMTCPAFKAYIFVAFNCGIRCRCIAIVHACIHRRKDLLLVGSVAR